MRRHRSEQWRTSSHTRSHFLRQVNGRAQVAQSLAGRSPLRLMRRARPIAYAVASFAFASAAVMDSFTRSSIAAIWSAAR